MSKREVLFRNRDICDILDTVKGGWPTNSVDRWVVDIFARVHPATTGNPNIGTGRLIKIKPMNKLV